MTWLTLASEEFEWDIVMMVDKTSGSQAGKYMLPESESKIVLGIAHLTNNVGTDKTANSTGSMWQNRDALIVVDGSRNDESGVERIMWRCHPNFGPAQKNRHDTLPSRDWCDCRSLGSTRTNNPRHWLVNECLRCKPAPSTEERRKA